MTVMSDSSIDSVFAQDQPRFVIGQLVRHRRYGYRGVIVDFDVCCQAGENWYQQNRTQPTKDQPWYHVFVDGSTAVTYAAESSLQPDASDQPIHHPLVPHFFERFDESSYERNDRPWPGWEDVESPSGGGEDVG